MAIVSLSEAMTSADQAEERVNTSISAGSPKERRACTESLPSAVSREDVFYRFGCPSCAARYALPVRMVVGRILRIRCKHCSIAFEITTPPEFPLEPPPVEGRTSLAKRGSRGWYVVNRGTRVGPLTSQDVRNRCASGEFGEQSYVWRQGLTQWLPLAEVTELHDEDDSVVPSSGELADAASDSGDEPTVVRRPKDGDEVPTVVAPLDSWSSDVSGSADKALASKVRTVVGRPESPSSVNGTALAGGPVPAVLAVSTTEYPPGFAENQLRDERAEFAADQAEFTALQDLCEPSESSVLFSLERLRETSAQHGLVRNPTDLLEAAGIVPTASALVRWVSHDSLAHRRLKKVLAATVVGVLLGGLVVFGVVYVLDPSMIRSSIGANAGADGSGGAGSVARAAVADGVAGELSRAAARGEEDPKPAQGTSRSSAAHDFTAGAARRQRSSDPLSAKPVGGAQRRQVKSRRSAPPSVPLATSPVGRGDESGADTVHPRVEARARLHDHKRFARRIRVGTRMAPAARARHRVQASSAAMPESLDEAQLVRGLAKARGAINKCREVHGEDGVLTVRMVIDGRRARVTRVEPLSAFFEEGLIHCVIAALRRTAQFQKFSGPPMTVTRPVILR